MDAEELKKDLNELIQKYCEEEKTISNFNAKLCIAGLFLIGFFLGFITGIFLPKVL